MVISNPHEMAANIMADVVHAKKGERHAILVSGLDVLVVPDGEKWFARGIQIDYAASGDSLEDVKSRFQRGFALTLAAHIAKFGNLQRLLKWAPKSVYKDFLALKEKLSFTCVSIQDIPEIASHPEIVDSLPIGSMQFAQAESDTRHTS